MKVNLLAVSLMSFFLAACEKNLKMDYTPTGQLKTNGALSLGYFKYSPAIMLKANQASVRNAQLDIFLDKDVTEYFKGSIKQELETAGIIVGENKTCKLDVTIDEFSYNNWGLAGHYGVKADYVISDASGRAIFNHHGETDLNAYNPFGSFEERLQEATAMNIQTFMADPNFAGTMVSRCKD